MDDAGLFGFCSRMYAPVVASTAQRGGTNAFRLVCWMGIGNQLRYPTRDPTRVKRGGGRLEECLIGKRRLRVRRGWHDKTSGGQLYPAEQLRHIFFIVFQVEENVATLL